MTRLESLRVLLMKASRDERKRDQDARTVKRGIVLPFRQSLLTRLRRLFVR